MTEFLYTQEQMLRIRNENYEAGCKDTENRIIKLLENPLHHNIRFPDEHINCYTCELIALIKGENK